MKSSWKVLFPLLLSAGLAAFACAPKPEMRMVLQVHGKGSTQPSQEQVARTAEVLRNRLDIAGAGDAEVTVSGDRVSIRVGGVEDPERIRRLLLSRANLEFRFVSFPEGGGGSRSREEVLQSYGGDLPPDIEILEGDELGEDGRKAGTLYYAVEEERVISGEDFQHVRPTRGQFDNPILEFQLTPEAASAFGEETAAHIGKGLAIVLNGRVVSAPVIRSRITDRGMIEGSFTEEEILDLATVLSSGALPAPVTVVEETSGPSR